MMPNPWNLFGHSDSGCRPRWHHAAFFGGRGGRGHHGPWVGPPGPHGGASGGPPWSFFRRGPRARRGDVRAGILALLAEQPRNGYQIMQELEQRSGGVWHPSPGSIYPSLQQLEDEGLVSSAASGTGRTFELTERGRAHVAEHRDEVSEPWASVGDAGDNAAAELMGLLREVAAAAAQVARAGDAAQLTKAKKVLGSARRELYRLLADEPDETP